MTLAVSRGFTPRATASVMMLVRSPRAVSLMTFQSLNVVSLAADIWFRYMLQMHAQMMCTGRKWCDFVSFDDRLPPDLAYFKKRIHFDEELAREIESEVKSFIADLESEIQKITERAA